jgi:hypothetical protein
MLIDMFAALLVAAQPPGAAAASAAGQDKPGAPTSQPSTVFEVLSTTSPVTAEQMVGRWTDTGDCGDATDFRADGRFVNANGTQGTWRLQGDVVTLDGSVRIVLIVRTNDWNRISVINRGDVLGGSTRC